MAARWCHLGDEVAQVPDTAAGEFARHFDEHPTRDSAAWTCDHIADRVGGLLDGDRGRP